MSFTEKLQREKLQGLNGQLNYANDCLLSRINEMEDFEVKEYLLLNSELKSEISLLENHIKNVF